MTKASPADKSPEELRAELSAKRAQLGDTVEELAHRVDVPSQVKAKKDETVAKLQDAKSQAAQRVHEGSEKVRAAIADKAPVVQQKVDAARAVYAEKAPPAVQHTVDQAVAKSRAVYAEQAPVVQDKVAKAQGVLAEKAPPVERTLREKPGLVAAVAVALVVLLIARSGRREEGVMERGNSKHSPREDDMLAAELEGELGPGGSNREEWAQAEPPADDDAPERVAPPIEEVGADDVPAADAQVRHDMNVANDWHGAE